MKITINIEYDGDTISSTCNGGSKIDYLGILEVLKNDMINDKREEAINIIDHDDKIARDMARRDFNNFGKRFGPGASDAH